MRKLPYPSTAKEFRMEYEFHSREELLSAIAELHVLHLERVTKNSDSLARLKDAVEYAVMMLSTITSRDGSGHADIARTVLVKAGYCPDLAKGVVEEFVKERTWGEK